MKRVKRWLEGGALALMMWVMVGSGLLLLPNKADAVYGLPLFNSWSQFEPPIQSYRLLDCEGSPMTMHSAREAYDANPGSWSQSGRCSNDISDLRAKARSEWNACNAGVRGGVVIAVVSVGAVGIIGGAPVTMTAMYQGFAILRLR